MWPFKKKAVEVKTEVSAQVPVAPVEKYRPKEVQKTIKIASSLYTVQLTSGKVYKGKLEGRAQEHVQYVNKHGLRNEQWRDSFFVRKWYGQETLEFKLPVNGTDYLFETLEGQRIQLPVSRIDSVVFEPITLTEQTVTDIISEEIPYGEQTKSLANTTLS